MALQSRVGFAAESIDANFIALLSDTHIGNAPSVTVRSEYVRQSQCGHFPDRQTCTAQPTYLSTATAYLKGLPEDYTNLSHSLAPLESLGIDLHVTMGNHDDRPQLYDALTKQRPSAPAV